MFSLILISLERKSLENLVVTYVGKKVVDFSSEVLVRGIYSELVVVLIEPGQKVKNDDRLG
ncbi:hypothetical protein CWR48_17965 [Oceanobacillus arenosus]|uniref:Uncharacterized protein n=1 Tax=Oceanobacillus arenosus TaxID=1229153 RepID=A0A3D8PK78_9BACI|nr:hypothetical protein CWR48_17965 [Oceanobacillus arenosus]